MKKSFVISLLFLVVFAIMCACAPNDKPPFDGSTAPPALSGTFVSEYGTLTFNGDGRTVSANVPDYFTGEGTYVFLFRNEEFRYDKAETFRITIDGQNYSFLINRGLTDGETFVFDLTGSGEGVAFRRTD